MTRLPLSLFIVGTLALFLGATRPALAAPGYCSEGVNRGVIPYGYGGGCGFLSTANTVSIFEDVVNNCKAEIPDGVRAAPAYFDDPQAPFYTAMVSAMGSVFSGVVLPLRSENNPGSYKWRVSFGMAPFRDRPMRDGKHRFAIYDNNPGAKCAQMATSDGLGWTMGNCGGTYRSLCYYGISPINVTVGADFPLLPAGDPGTGNETVNLTVTIAPGVHDLDIIGTINLITVRLPEGASWTGSSGAGLTFSCTGPSCGAAVGVTSEGYGPETLGLASAVTDAADRHSLTLTMTSAVPVGNTYTFTFHGVKLGPDPGAHVVDVKVHSADSTARVSHHGVGVLWRPWFPADARLASFNWTGDGLELGVLAGERLSVDILGRVAFSTKSMDLPNAMNNVPQVALTSRDYQSLSTEPRYFSEIVSSFHNPLDPGDLVRGQALEPMLSAYGTHLVFSTPDPYNVSHGIGTRRVIVRSLRDHGARAALASADASGQVAPAHASDPCISADGTLVTFTSNPTDAYAPLFGGARYPYLANGTDEDGDSDTPEPWRARWVGRSNVDGGPLEPPRGLADQSEIGSLSWTSTCSVDGNWVALVSPDARQLGNFSELGPAAMNPEGPYHIVLRYAGLAGKFESNGTQSNEVSGPGSHAPMESWIVTKSVVNRKGSWPDLNVSGRPSVSQEGRFVAYESASLVYEEDGVPRDVTHPRGPRSGSLIPFMRFPRVPDTASPPVGPDPAARKVLLYERGDFGNDLQQGKLDWIGRGSNGWSGEPAVAAYNPFIVAFISTSTDLTMDDWVPVPGQAPLMEPLATPPAPPPPQDSVGNGGSAGATALIGGDAPFRRLYVHDTRYDDTRLVSVDKEGKAWGSVGSPAISPFGSTIAVIGNDHAQAPGKSPDGTHQVYAFDLERVTILADHGVALATGEPVVLRVRAHRFLRGQRMLQLELRHANGDMPGSTVGIGHMVYGNGSYVEEFDVPIPGTESIPSGTYHVSVRVHISMVRDVTPDPGSSTFLEMHEIPLPVSRVCSAPLDFTVLGSGLPEGLLRPTRAAAQLGADAALLGHSLAAHSWEEQVQQPSLIDPNGHEDPLSTLYLARSVPVGAPHLGLTANTTATTLSAALRAFGYGTAIAVSANADYGDAGGSIVAVSAPGTSFFNHTGIGAVFLRTGEAVIDSSYPGVDAALPHNPLGLAPSAFKPSYFAETVLRNVDPGPGSGTYGASLAAAGRYVVIGDPAGGTSGTGLVHVHVVGHLGAGEAPRVARLSAPGGHSLFGHRVAALRINLGNGGNNNGPDTYATYLAVLSVNPASVNVFRVEDQQARTTHNVVHLGHIPVPDGGGMGLPFPGNVTLAVSGDRALFVLGVPSRPGVGGGGGGGGGGPGGNIVNNTVGLVYLLGPADTKNMDSPWVISRTIDGAKIDPSRFGGLSNPLEMFGRALAIDWPMMYVGIDTPDGAGGFVALEFPDRHSPTSFVHVNHGMFGPGDDGARSISVGRRGASVTMPAGNDGGTVELYDECLDAELDRIGVTVSSVEEETGLTLRISRTEIIAVANYQGNATIKIYPRSVNVTMSWRHSLSNEHDMSAEVILPPIAAIPVTLEFPLSAGGKSSIEVSVSSPNGGVGGPTRYRVGIYRKEDEDNGQGDGLPDESFLYTELDTGHLLGPDERVLLTQGQARALSVSLVPYPDINITVFVYRVHPEGVVVIDHPTGQWARGPADYNVTENITVRALVDPQYAGVTREFSVELALMVPAGFQPVPNGLPLETLRASIEFDATLTVFTDGLIDAGGGYVLSLAGTLNAGNAFAPGGSSGTSHALNPIPGGAATMSLGPYGSLFRATVPSTITVLIRRNVTCGDAAPLPIWTSGSDSMPGAGVGLYCTGDKVAFVADLYPPGDASIPPFAPDTEPVILNATSPVTDGMWHAVSVRYSASRSQFSLFVDGDLVASSRERVVFPREGGSIDDKGVGGGAVCFGSRPLAGACDLTAGPGSSFGSPAPGVGGPLEARIDQVIVLGYALEEFRFREYHMSLSGLFRTPANSTLLGRVTGKSVCLNSLVVLGSTDADVGSNGTTLPLLDTSTGAGVTFTPEPASAYNVSAPCGTSWLGFGVVSCAAEGLNVTVDCPGCGLGPAQQVPLDGAGSGGVSLPAPAGMGDATYEVRVFDAVTGANLTVYPVHVSTVAPPAPCVSLFDSAGTDAAFAELMVPGTSTSAPYSPSVTMYDVHLGPGTFGSIGLTVQPCAHCCGPLQVTSNSTVGGNSTAPFDVAANGNLTDIVVPTVGVPATIDVRVAANCSSSSSSVDPAPVVYRFNLIRVAGMSGPGCISQIEVGYRNATGGGALPSALTPTPVAMLPGPFSELTPAYTVALPSHDAEYASLRVVPCDPLGVGNISIEAQSLAVLAGASSDPLAGANATNFTAEFQIPPGPTVIKVNVSNPAGPWPVYTVTFVRPEIPLCIGGAIDDLGGGDLPIDPLGFFPFSGPPPPTWRHVNPSGAREQLQPAPPRLVYAPMVPSGPTLMVTGSLCDPVRTRFLFAEELAVGAGVPPSGSFSSMPVPTSGLPVTLAAPGSNHSAYFVVETMPGEFGAELNPTRNVTYELVFYELKNDAELVSLDTNPSLGLTYSPGVTAYSLSTTSSTTSTLQFTATCSDPTGCEVDMGAQFSPRFVPSGVISSAAPLGPPGTSSLFNLSVRAEYRPTTVNITVSVYRMNNDITLATLSHDAVGGASFATLVPAFSPAVTQYTLSVSSSAYGTGPVNFTATTTDPLASMIMIPYSGGAVPVPSPISASVNTLVLDITAEDTSVFGAVAVNVRAMSTGTGLASLALRDSTGASLSLSPAMTTAVTAYAVVGAVGSTMATVDLTAICANATCAGYTVSTVAPAPASTQTLASGSTSAAITLGPAGSTTTITVSVLPEDSLYTGAKLTYTVAVARAAAPTQNPQLAGLHDTLGLHGVAPNAPHAAGTFAYPVLNAAESNTSVAVRAVCVEPGCSVTVTWTPSPPGSPVAVPTGATGTTFSTPQVPLAPGATTTLTVTSTAQNASVPPAVYTLSYFRPAPPGSLPSSDAALVSLGPAFAGTGFPAAGTAGAQGSKGSASATESARLTVASGAASVSVSPSCAQGANCTGFVIAEPATATPAGTMASPLAPGTVVTVPLGSPGSDTRIVIRSIAQDTTTVLEYLVVVRRPSGNADLLTLRETLGLLPAGGASAPFAAEYGPATVLASALATGSVKLVVTVACVDPGCTATIAVAATGGATASAGPIPLPGAGTSGGAGVASPDLVALLGIAGAQQAAALKSPVEITVTVTVNAEDQSSGAAAPTVVRLRYTVVPDATSSGSPNGVPVVYSVVPPTASVAGGAIVNVTGSAFGSRSRNLLSVSLAGVPCTVSKWISSSLVTCEVAPHPLGPAGAGRNGTVVVSTLGGQSPASPGAGVPLFTYTRASALVISARPRVVDPSGGTTITLRGENFGTSAPGSLDVVVGGAPCTDPKWLSSTEITCTSPAMPAGIAEGQSLKAVVTVDGVVGVASSLGEGPLALRFGPECNPACSWNEACIAGQCSGCLAGWSGPPTCATPALTRGEPSRKFTSEDGDTVTFEVRLAQSSGPTALVVAMVSSKPEEADVVPSAVTFTDADWGTPRTVTVRGKMDDRRDGNATYHVDLKVVSGENVYLTADKSALPSRVDLVNLDSKPVAISVEPKISPLEGRNVTILASKLDRNVAVIVRETGKAARIYARRPKTATATATAARKSTLSSTSSRSLLPSSSSPSSSSSSRRHVLLAPLVALPEVDTSEEYLDLVLPPVGDTRYVDLEVINIGDVNRTAGIFSVMYYTDTCPEAGQIFVKGQCVSSCPKGAECPGGNRVWPLPGYWNSGESSGFVEPCNPVEACVGGRFSACRVGHEGEFCAECSEDFYSLQGLCEPCPVSESVTYYMIVDAIVWIGVALCCAFMRQQDLLSNSIGFVRMLQTFSGLVSMRPAGGASWVNFAWDILKFFSGDYSVVKPDCITPIPYWVKFTGSILYNTVLFMPAWVMIFLVRSWSLFQVEKNCDRPEQMASAKTYWKDRMKRVLFLWYLVVVLPITVTCLGAIACKPSGVGPVLIVDPSVRCFKGAHIPIFCAALLLVLLLCFAMPVHMYRVTSRNRHRLFEDRRVKERNGPIYELYRPSRYNSWILEIVVVLAIAVCLTGFKDSDIAQTVVIGGAFVVRLLHSIFFLPMSDLPSNVQEILTSLVGAFIIITNFLSKRGVIEVDASAADIMAIATIVIIGIAVLIAFTVIGQIAVVGRAAIKPEDHVDTIGEFKDWASGGEGFSDGERGAGGRRVTMADLFSTTEGAEEPHPLEGMYLRDANGDLVLDKHGVPVLSDEGVMAQMDAMEMNQAAEAAAAAGNDEHTLLGEVVDFFSGLFRDDTTAAGGAAAAYQHAGGDTASVASGAAGGDQRSLPHSGSFTDIANRGRMPTSESFTDLAQRRASVVPHRGQQQQQQQQHNYSDQAFHAPGMATATDHDTLV